MEAVHQQAYSIKVHNLTESDIVANVYIDGRRLSLSLLSLCDCGSHGRHPAVMGTGHAVSHTWLYPNDDMKIREVVTRVCMMTSLEQSVSIMPRLSAANQVCWTSAAPCLGSRSFVMARP